METVQMYHDVPAIELETQDFPSTFGSYPVPPGLGLSMDEGSALPRPSVYLDHMREYLVYLSDSASGYRPSTALPFPGHNSLGCERSPTWGPGTEPTVPMRYMSPHGPWGGSLSSTNSAPSDPAFSPVVSRSQAALFGEDADLSSSYGAHYSVPLSPDHYFYPSQGSGARTLVASPAPTEKTMACTMKELQYCPDPKTEDVLAATDGIQFTVTGTRSMSPASENWTFPAHPPREVDYDESMMTDVSGETHVESDVDQETTSPSGHLQSTSKSSRQRPLSQQSTAPVQHAVLRSQNASHRISKPSHQHTVAARNKRRNPTSRRPSTKKGEVRSFVCAFSHYGCDSRFSSKNEWKRHVASKHLQLAFYRCDTGNCNPDSQLETRPGDGVPSPNPHSTYNDFNRKDLFTQHHRRMHTPWPSANESPSKKAKDEFEESLEQVRTRCWREIRKPPSSSQCIFCSQIFQGEAAWEDRMEHIGKHFEEAERKNIRLGLGDEDPGLRAWGLQEGIIVREAVGTGPYYFRLADTHHSHTRGQQDVGHQGPYHPDMDRFRADHISWRPTTRVHRSRRIASADELEQEQDTDADGDEE